jgi:hypothetical protein
MDHKTASLLAIVKVQKYKNIVSPFSGISFVNESFNKVAYHN